MPITRRRLLTFRVPDGGTPHRRWIRVQRTAMACRFEVTLHDEDALHVAASREALDEATRVEALLTVFRESSELSRINREAETEAGAGDVDAELMALLRRCAVLHVATDGAFDITSTPVSRCWGFLQRNGHVPAEADIEAARASIGLANVTLDDTTHRVQFERPGMALNLGAIGKGYALDRMAGALERRGVERALLSAGGSSVRALGGGSRGWPIDLRSPQIPRSRLARVWLSDGALGTSGAGEQFVVSDGTRYGHVIDPRTGWPARGVLSATAITADAADADALSTAFLVGGPDLAAQYCDAHPGTLAVLTLDDGTECSRVFGRYPGAVLED